VTKGHFEGGDWEEDADNDIIFEEEVGLHDDWKCADCGRADGEGGAKWALDDNTVCIECLHG